MSGDVELQKRVLDELAWEPTVDATHIGVAARDGVVTLTGHVASFAEKLSVARVAGRVKGVRAIAQEIDVVLPASDRRSDEDIAASALSVLRWHTGLPSERVKLVVENGHVSLSGEVDWQYQRRLAEKDVRKIRGVRGVVNLIAVAPMVQPVDMEQKIEAAFRRSAALEAAQISVSAAGGAVTLSGRVRSWHEREVAEQVAWSAPGVTAVIDHLHVEG